jgi:hypothetical protein
MIKTFMLICVSFVAVTFAQADGESNTVMFDVVKGKNQQIWDLLAKQYGSSEWGGGDISVWQSANVNIRCFVPTESTDISKDQMSCEISPVVKIEE